MKKEIKKSVAAGLLIGLGNIVRLTTENQYVGALLFSLGLLSIICFNLHLFTGKVGFYDKKKQKGFLSTILLGNLMGSLVITIIAILARPNFLINIQKVANLKFANNAISIFFLAALCGICMQIAVQSKNVIIVIFSIMAFVLCGFEHCVADFPFLMVIPLKFANFSKFALIATGNAVGARFFRFFTKSNN